MKHKLKNQLLILSIIAIITLIISLGFILPKKLTPIYEKNIYLYLKQPLTFIENNIDNTNIDSEIAYLYIKDNNVITSDNFNNLIKVKDLNKFISQINLEYGKIKYNNKTYYYNTSRTAIITKIAITNDNYIKSIRKSIFKTIIFTVGITFLIITLILLYWSNNLVSKINKIKDKVDNLNNFEYEAKNLKEEDPLYSLDNAINDMKIYLIKQEEYKNQMYQNISHDLKTPITVMKSYIEASEDGVETKEKTLKIIKEQLNKLDGKVHSLLYLNKINYIKDKKDSLNDKIDVTLIIKASIDKFKLSNPNIEFEMVKDSKNVLFKGSQNMWEAIIDNIISNFVRYAEQKIKITIKNNKIIMYNDGPNIDKDVLNSIFTPYEKGVKGVFGLGLSIVKNTLHLLEYDIDIKNEKKGVNFIIYKKK